MAKRGPITSKRIGVPYHVPDGLEGPEDRLSYVQGSFSSQHGFISNHTFTVLLALMVITFTVIWAQSC